MARGIEAPAWAESVMQVRDLAGMTHKLLQFTAFSLERLSPERLFVLMGMIYQHLRGGKMWGVGIVLRDLEAASFRALAA